jgi:hypothetical protein
MDMLGSKMIEMMHFPCRLNMGISSVSFPINQEEKYSGFEILKRYVNESIIMTGKYCSEYAVSKNCNKDIVRLINDTWGNFPEEKKIKLKPNYSLEYKDFRNYNTIYDCITINFPNVEVDIETTTANKMNIENLADLILKAGIKSLTEANLNSVFSLNIFRVNTKFGSFQKLNYSELPRIQKEDFNLLISEIVQTKVEGHKFLYFYHDKWDFHYSNFKYEE